jgi:16S rRNA (guanine966-N2)-methyltransferase
MKDRTREAVMSLLGGTFKDAVAFDLFAGTGVLAFETVSRGAAKGIVFEILKSAAREIQNNAKSLGILDKIEVVQTDVLDWSKGLPGNCERFHFRPEQLWVVFCCPPYALWGSDGQQLKEMIDRWWQAAPSGSLFAIELEEATPRALLPAGIDWDVRLYRPAQMAVAEKS